MSEQDWRLKVWGIVSKDTNLPGGGLAEKGAVCKVVSVVKLRKNKKTLTIPVPELSAVYINSSYDAWCKYKQIRKESDIDKSIKGDVSFKSDYQAFNAIEHLSVSVIMAYSAIEAFCNDSIPLNHEYWHNKKSEIIVEMSNKEDLERRFSTGEKLITILPEIFEVESPKGKKAWQSYIKLKKVRDSLVHAKSAEVRSVGEDENNLWDKLFLLEAPYILAKDVLDWYLKSKKENAPKWYSKYPK